MLAPVIFTPVKGHDLVFELFKSIAFWGRKFHFEEAIVHTSEGWYPAAKIPLRFPLYESGKVLRGLFGLVVGLFSSSKNGTSVFCGRV
jgi:hypothetical protein